MNDVEIFYFSGTGNSLFVAKELEEHLTGAALRPMVSFAGSETVQATGTLVGLVFPVHLSTVPKPVRQFLMKLSLPPESYVFAVVTRGGSLAVADITVNRILKRAGRRLDSYFVIDMTHNSPTGLRPGKGDANWAKAIDSSIVAAKDARICSEIREIADAVRTRAKSPKSSGSGSRRVIEGLVSSLVRGIKSEIPYYVDEGCTGCGTCERVCPSGKIKLSQGKPEWQGDVGCFYCYACFNFCPHQAILHKRYPNKDGRYMHPGVTADEIAKQKSSE